MFRFSRNFWVSLSIDFGIFLLGAMWMVSGVMKLMNLIGIIDVVMQYQILPPSWVVMAASTLPWFEVLIGFGMMMCLLPYLRRFTENRLFLLTLLWMSLVLLGIFLIAMGSVMLRGLVVSCGCFGSESQQVGWWTIGRDIGLMVLNWMLLGKVQKIVPPTVTMIS